MMIYVLFSLMLRPPDFCSYKAELRVYNLYASEHTQFEKGHSKYKIGDNQLHIHTVRIQSFKRFSNLTITALPATARLIILAGPNGSGKSSLFDAFNTWFNLNSRGFQNWDIFYHQKAGAPTTDYNQAVNIDFHEAPAPRGSETAKTLFYIRSAYRNEADFTLSGLNNSATVVDAPRAMRMIDNDTNVADNYQRLASQSMRAVYSGEYDNVNVRDLREMYIGQLREPMRRMFGDLLLRGLGNPLEQGSFYFDKGTSSDFHYKNLSAGEKSAFNILLDFVVKRDTYNNTVYCIDEPETHINTKLQSLLLEELVRLTPPNCQLWIATHSIGMMRKARDLQEANPDEIVFLDFFDRNFDEPTYLTPARVDRRFWAKTLYTAFDDMAKLIAPKQVVLCEGKPPSSGDRAKSNAEFDAKCYRAIFGEQFPDTDFISVGNSSDVHTDRLEIGKTIQAIVPGTAVLRIIDRDDRSDQEVAELNRDGVRVLSRRLLEAYLLDDEIIMALCVSVNQADKVAELIQLKRTSLEESRARGNPPDDIKSAAGNIYTGIKRILSLTQCGNDSPAFLLTTMAPLVAPNTSTYETLKQDVFGS